VAKERVGREVGQRKAFANYDQFTKRQMKEERSTVEGGGGGKKVICR